MGPTVVAGSPLRALAWKRPKLPQGRSYPAVLELGLERIRASFEKRGGALWEAASKSPVWNGELRDIGRRKIRTEGTRVRRLRRDGATNFCAFLQACVAAADLNQGYLGRPGEQRWDRHTFERIDHYAFGDQVERERSLRRTERMARIAKSLGLLEVRELKVAENGEWRSVPAIKFVTDKLWNLLGLAGYLRAERNRRKRAKGEQVKAAIVKSIGAGTNTDRRREQRALQRQAPAAASSIPQGRVPSVDDGPPRGKHEPTDVGRSFLEQIGEKFGKRRS
jgi:hypothetical protein